MTIEAKKLVQKIQQANEEVVFLKKKIDETGHEKLNQIIQYAMKGLEFEAIHMVAAYNDVLSEEDGELFTNKQGEILKGVKVMVSIEDADIEADFEWELHKEVFLLNDGSLKTFDTMYRSKNCIDCGVTHSNLERQEASVDYESEYKIDALIHNILVLLKSAYESIEKSKVRLSDRLNDLQAVKVS